MTKYFQKHSPDVDTICCSHHVVSVVAIQYGTSENAGHENLAQSKMQGWILRDMKIQHKNAGMENEAHIPIESQQAVTVTV